MQPRTKQQKEVFDLSKKLPKLTATQERWAENKCRAAIGCNSGSKTWCLHCGAMFQSNGKRHTTCPHCGEMLRIEDTKVRTFKKYDYFSIITTIGGWQVIRHFQIYQHAKKNSHNDINMCELIQVWINDKGEYQVVARKQHLMNMFGNYDAAWDWTSDLEIRDIDKRYGRLSEKYDLFPRNIYPRMKTLPILRRNGFSNEFYLSPFTSFYYLIKDWQFEVLWKNRQVSLLKRFYRYSVPYTDKVWNSIKIANRHHYKISDADLWIDYWNLLNRFGYDTNNPHYICPKDLNVAHDEMVKKKEKADGQDRLKRMIADNEEYIEKKGKFFGVCFMTKEKDIVVSVIKSIKDVYEEGKAMHHCVFENEYHKKDRSLLLTAKDKTGERLETIEVDLETFNVLQSRGKFNTNSPQHDRIVSLIEKNMKKIKKIAVT